MLCRCPRPPAAGGHAAARWTSCTAGGTPTAGSPIAGRRTAGTFRGEAVFSWSDSGGLTYLEEGELSFAGHTGPARRSLLYVPGRDGDAEVLFADRRPFYRLDLRSGSWAAEHLCARGPLHRHGQRAQRRRLRRALAGRRARQGLRDDHDPDQDRAARMTAGEYRGTIPRLLLAAADRDPGGTWVRSDQGCLTFAGAVAATGLTAQALADAGVRRGDLVMLTAITTPSYLLCWLALTAMGAVAVAVNPRSTAAELAGLIGQTQPRAVVTDETLAALVADAINADGNEVPVLDVAGLLPPDWADPEAMAAAADRVRLPAPPEPDDLAVLIPTSGTTGRSKLVMQTHRAYAMAGEGFPFWMELTAADRLHDDAAAVPRERPGVLGHGVARLRGRAGAGRPVLGQRLPGLRPAARRDGVQRDRRDAGDPDAPAGTARRRGDAAAAVLHRPGTGAGPAAGDRGAVRLADRRRLRDVGVALRADLAARHPALRHARHGPPAPGLGVVNEARVIDEAGGAARPGEHAASCSCATRS